MAEHPVTLSHRSHTVKVGRWVVWAFMARQSLKWFKRRIFVPIARHPLSWPAIFIECWALSVGLMLALYVIMVGVLGLLMLYLWAPESYRQHILPRIQGFISGFRYRYRPRMRLHSCQLLDPSDPVPPIASVTAIGPCVRRVRIKMAPGDEIELWRSRSRRLAQTYKSHDCTVNQAEGVVLSSVKFDQFLLRPPFVRLHFEETDDKVQWLDVDFLVKNPFRKVVSVDYMDFYATEQARASLQSQWHQLPIPEWAVPVAACRTGLPYWLDLTSIHMLSIAMTRQGKSNSARAMLRAYYRRIMAHEIEFWGLDGKGGVEFGFMKHLFAKYCFGDDHTDPMAFKPEAFLEILNEAVKVMMQRQRLIRGEATKWVATSESPWIVIMIDEILALVSKLIKPEVRIKIERCIALIQQQGIACGVTIVAFSQLAQKEEVPFRGGFTDFQVGRSEAIVADMIFGQGAWEAGARVNYISKRKPGIFYAKGEGDLAPEQIRYVKVTDEDALALEEAPATLYGKREIVSNWAPYVVPATEPVATNGHKTNGHKPEPDGVVVPDDARELEQWPTVVDARSENGNGHKTETKHFIFTDQE